MYNPHEWNVGAQSGQKLVHVVPPLYGVQTGIASRGTSLALHLASDVDPNE